MERNTADVGEDGEEMQKGRRRCFGRDGRPDVVQSIESRMGWMEEVAD